MQHHKQTQNKLKHTQTQQKHTQQKENNTQHQFKNTKSNTNKKNPKITTHKIKKKYAKVTNATHNEQKKIILAHFCKRNKTKTMTSRLVTKKRNFATKSSFNTQTAQKNRWPDKNETRALRKTSQNTLG